MENTKAPIDRRCDALREAQPLKTLHELLRAKLDDVFQKERWNAWISEIYADYIIVRAYPLEPGQDKYANEDKAKLYRLFYAADGDSVWLDDPEEVIQVYAPVTPAEEPASESMPPELEAGLEQIVEAYRRDGIEGLERLGEGVGPIIRAYGEWAGTGPGSFARCVGKLREKKGIKSPEKLCAWLHRRATGVSPGAKSRESAAPAEAVLSEWVPLREARRSGKRVELTIIQEGMGNPRDRHYYPADTLAREAASFAGVRMYADHPTPQEEAQRPERSIRDLVAVIESARYDPQGPEGRPAVVGEARIVAPWFEQFLEAAWPYLGVSINAVGKVRPATIDGKPVKLVESIPVKHSVDFVTAAGAGGQITRILESLGGTRGEVSEMDLKTLTLEQLRESRKDLLDGVIKALTLQELKEARGDLVEAIRKEEKDKVYGEKDKLTERMTETEKQLKALQAENAKLTERLLLGDQMAIVGAKLRESKLPEFVQERLSKQFAGQLYRKDDGSLDTQKLNEALDRAIADEKAYIAKLTESGKVRGMGVSAGADGAPVSVKDEVARDMEALFGLKPAKADGKGGDK